MKFIVDENLPRRLCGWLTAMGHQAMHVSDIGLLDAADPDVNRRAAMTGAVIVTRDADFLQTRQPRPAGVVRLKIGNCSKPVLIARVEALWPEIEARLETGEQLIEIG